MSKLKVRINKNIFERCLLTEIMPYETPILFSNWGSFNYTYRLRNKNLKVLDSIFKRNKPTISFTYRIKKDLNDWRTIQIPHPNISEDTTNIYKKFDVMITKTCTKSSYSIRAPHNIAEWFTIEEGHKNDYKYIEQIDENNAYAASYFTYRYYSHLYKFYESKQFAALENRFYKMATFDVAKCFPSIYTHSIDWAIRGKYEAKRLLFINNSKSNSFPKQFDDLMQNMNYKETNGILIGPEISRIFSEIIFQAVDHSVEKRLATTELNYKQGTDYYCCRYMDDYYLFYNDEKVLDCFESILKTELEIFKLYLNPHKREISTRPFITEASLLKMEISKYVNDLEYRLKEIQKKDGDTNINRIRIKPENEINKVRALIGQRKNSLQIVSSYFLTSLNSSFISLTKGNKKADYIFNIALVYVEIALHWFKLDIRVAGSYKIIELTNEIMRLTKHLNHDQISIIKATMYYELTDAVSVACSRKSIIESLNLLICLKNLGANYVIPHNLISCVLSSSQVEFPEDRVKVCRNSYFDIVTVLYYVDDRIEFCGIKAKLLDQAKRIISSNNIKIYSETALLFLDLISCPHIELAYKRDIMGIVANQLGVSSKESDINRYIKNISAYSWFFNWTYGNDLRNILRKKKLMLSY